MKEKIFEKLENILCQHKTGQEKLNPQTVSFLQFWADGGVHKAVEKMGWISLRQMAEGKGVSREILDTLEKLFEKETER